MRDNTDLINQARNRRRGNNFLLAVLGILIIILGCFFIYIARNKQESYGLITESEVNMPARVTKITDPVPTERKTIEAVPEKGQKTEPPKPKEVKKPENKQDVKEKVEKEKTKSEQIKASAPKPEPKVNDVEKLKPTMPVATTGYAYKVKRGDNIEAIAKRFGVSADELKKDNNLTENKIKGDGKLKIRIQALHMVETGDRIIKLAKKYHLKPEQIRRANNLKNDNIQLGKRIVIPVS